MSRSLWPREHGAYAQLLAPLVTALAVTPPTWQAALVAVAACLAFLANEPLLVVLGHRGRRMREQDGRRARQRLAILVVAATVAGGVSLALSPRSVAELAGIVAVPAIVTIVLAWRRAEKSIIGECVAALALSGASAVVLVASGSSQRAAMAVWAAWAVGYACTVVAVHRVIARHKASATWRDAFAALVLAVVAGGAMALSLDATRVAALGDASDALGAAAPLALASLVLVVRPPRATYLRTIGFVLVGASLVAGVLAALALRS